MIIPDQAELEKRLGEPYKLDGSFASMWAVECLCESMRRVPHCSTQLSWVAEYLADFFARAYNEMGMTVERPTRTIVRTTAPVFYEVDTEKDMVLLLSSQKSIPTFYKTLWIPTPLLGSAFIPWYALANIFQNYTHAKTDHDMIGNQRDRMDRAVPWLTEEWVKSLNVPEHLQQLAHYVSRAMVWPPLGYHGNDYGEYNLPHLKNIIDDADAQDARTVLDAFVACQNTACHRLASATAMHFAIPPDEPHEARRYQEARSVMRLKDIPPFIEEAINALLTTPEGDLEGTEDREYARAFKAPGEEGLALARALVAHYPNREVYHCIMGVKLEDLGRFDEAIDVYNRALRLNPNYVQVYINMGTIYSRQGDFQKGAGAFFKAREVEPFNIHLRNNLMINYYMSRA